MAVGTHLGIREMESHAYIRLLYLNSGALLGSDVGLPSIDAEAPHPIYTYLPSTEAIVKQPSISSRHERQSSTVGDQNVTVAIRSGSTGQKQNTPSHILRGTHSLSWDLLLRKYAITNKTSR